jgi:hypothetical protein
MPRVQNASMALSLEQKIAKVRLQMGKLHLASNDAREAMREGFEGAFASPLNGGGRCGHMDEGLGRKWLTTQVRGG